MAYVGDTRSHALLARCREEGVGQIIVRGRLKGRRLARWAYDNGAFEDWRHERPFDSAQFSSDLEAMEASPPPDFCLLPDIVAGGLASLALSLDWLARVPRHDWYLAVQDGMVPRDIPWDCGVVGIFVGGTLAWKLSSAAAWVFAARAQGLRCHVGRVGTRRRVAWAKDIGADSIDSCLPMWSRENARLFFDCLRQGGLFSAKETHR